MSPTIAITGGFGYLGGRIANHLAGTGYAVRLLVRGGEDRRPPWAAGMNVADLDLTDESTLTNSLDDVDRVVHLAALNAGDCAKDPAAAERVNIQGTEKLLRAANAVGVGRIIYLSTAHVYGAPLAGRLNETSPTQNTHPYATTHLAAETAVRRAADIEGVTLRLANGVGAPMDSLANCWMLLANDLCRQAFETRRLVLRGTGWEQRDFVPVVEIARAIRHFLELDADALGNGLFNLAAGRSMCSFELARLIAERAARIDGYMRPIDHAPDDGARPTAIEISTARLSASGFQLDADLTGEIDATLEFCRRTFGNG